MHMVVKLLKIHPKDKTYYPGNSSVKLQVDTKDNFITQTHH